MDQENALHFIHILLMTLEVSLVIITLAITAEKSISGVIRYYQFQAAILVIVVGLTALTKLVGQSNEVLLGTVVLFLLISLLLAIFWWRIRPVLKHSWQRVEIIIVLLVIGVLLIILARLPMKTVVQSASNFWLLMLISLLPATLGWYILEVLQHITIMESNIFKPLTAKQKADVLHIWENSEPEQQFSEQKIQDDPLGEAIAATGRNKDRTGYDMLMSGVLLAIAFFAAFLIFPVTSNENVEALTKSVGLAVALCLHLVGLYNTTIRRDIISLVVGVLIMDHGLYLAVVKIVAVPVPAFFFALALVAYTIITILILVFMVPQLIRSIAEEEARGKQAAGIQLIERPTIDLGRIASTSPLKETESGE
jgi:hypothetical protein